MRYALLQEVTRSGKYLAGNNLTAIRDFLDTLAKVTVLIVISISVIENGNLVQQKKKILHSFSIYSSSVKNYKFHFHKIILERK